MYLPYILQNCHVKCVFDCILMSGQTALYADTALTKTGVAVGQLFLIRAVAV